MRYFRTKELFLAFKNCFASCWQEEFTHYLLVQNTWLCLRKEKKNEPSPNDTDFKKILNFKEEKMTLPLCTVSRKTHCCLSIVSEADSSIRLQQHLSHSITVFATKGVGNGMTAHFLTTPLFITRTHPGREYCILFHFLYLFLSYFPFYHPY